MIPRVDVAVAAPALMGVLIADGDADVRDRAHGLKSLRANLIVTPFGELLSGYRTEVDPDAPLDDLPLFLDDAKRAGVVHYEVRRFEFGHFPANNPHRHRVECACGSTPSVARWAHHLADHDA